MKGLSQTHSFEHHDLGMKHLFGSTACKENAVKNQTKATLPQQKADKSPHV